MRKVLVAAFLAIFTITGCGTDILEENLRKSDIRFTTRFEEAGVLVVYEGVSGSSYIYDYRSNPYRRSYEFWIYIGFAVESFNEVGGRIADWQFQIIGSGKTIMSVTKSNYNPLFGPYLASYPGLAIPGYKFNNISLSKRSSEPDYHIEFFRGMIPDKIQAKVHIKDDNGYSYTIKKAVPFDYRYFSYPDQ